MVPGSHIIDPWARIVDYDGLHSRPADVDRNAGRGEHPSEAGEAGPHTPYKCPRSSCINQIPEREKSSGTLAPRESTSLC